jgi:RND superfamily putative drug exporter
VVFGAFSFAGILLMTQIGRGMAVALDVTVIRLVVVPAATRLMDARNWWMPGRRAAARRPAARGRARPSHPGTAPADLKRSVRAGVPAT